MQPDAIMTKMIWQGYGGLSSTTQTSPYSTAVKMNSLRTPGSGMGFIDTSAFNADPNTAYTLNYTNYVVMSSKIELTITNLNSTDTLFFNLIPFTSSGYSGASGSNALPFIEAPYSNYVILKPNGTAGCSETLKSYMGLGKLFGTSREDVLIDSGFNALTTLGADPVKLGFWVLAMKNSTSAYILATFHIKIIFYTKFFQRNVMPT